MAKLRNPLMSLDAAGTIARALTFSRVTSGAVAKKKPAGPVTRSPMQLEHRQIYRDACAAWNALSPVQRETWVGPADQLRLTGFNAYLQNYMITHYPPWPAGSTILPFEPYWDLHYYGRITPDGSTLVGYKQTPDRGAAVRQRLNQPTETLQAASPEGYTGAGCVSDDGDIVGGQTTQGGMMKACYWDRAGNVYPFTVDPTEYYVWVQSGNHDLTITYGSVFRDPDEKVFRHINRTDIELLPDIPGVSYYSPQTCNHDGNQLAMSYYIGDDYFATIWDDITGYSPLPLPLGQTRIWCYNGNRDLSTLVGMAEAPGPYLPCYWDADHLPHLLPLPLGYAQGEAGACNHDGSLIFGHCWDPAGYTPFFWTNAADPQPLAPLPPGYLGRVIDCTPDGSTVIIHDMAHEPAGPYLFKWTP
jgi:hypothetical protein